MFLQDWLRWLFEPANAQAAKRLAQIHQGGPAWWQIHIKLRPLPRLKRRADEVRTAFMRPFLDHVAWLTDYADKTTRTHARIFWDVCRTKDEAFWLQFTDAQVGAWATSTDEWQAARDLVFKVSP